MNGQFIDKYPALKVTAATFRDSQGNKYLDDKAPRHARHLPWCDMLSPLEEHCRYRL